MSIFSTIKAGFKTVSTGLQFGSKVSDNRVKRQLAKEGDKTQTEKNIHDEKMKAMESDSINSYGATKRFWLDSCIDFFSRLPRPIIGNAVGTLLVIQVVTPFILFVSSKISYADMFTLYSSLATSWGGLISAVVGFYFGSRLLEKNGAGLGSFFKSLSEIKAKKEIKKEEVKKDIEVSKHNTEVEKEKIKSNIVDKNNDGLDDRGMKQLQKHEGLRLKVYKCTAGKNTIGYGRNLDDKGITKNEAEHLFSNDVKDFKKSLFEKLPWIEKLNIARQWVLINMAFNMGIAGILKWKNTLGYIENGDYKKAANEMKNSRWANQVGNRAKELCEQMESGEFV